MIPGRCSLDRRNRNCKALLRTASETWERRTGTVGAWLGQELHVRILEGMWLGGPCDWPSFKHSRSSGLHLALTSSFSKSRSLSKHQHPRWILGCWALLALL